jgi:hypothetical protein
MDQIPAMLQTLLTDRFDRKFKRESGVVVAKRVLSNWEVEPARGGEPSYSSSLSNRPGPSPWKKRGGDQESGLASVALVLLAAGLRGGREQVFQDRPDAPAP